MRFALLIVLTVALLSVAFRIHSHPSSSAHGRSPLPHASPSVPTSVLPSATTRPPRTPPATTGGSDASGPGVAGTGAAGPPTLPVTGWDEAVKLGALAMLLIGGGTLAMRAGAPRRQPGSTVQD